ncbi:MAG: PH domain-containing protein [Bacteroidota bacterium]|nr:PH domain-containing protein [Bacteroidota bacterium]
MQSPLVHCQGVEAQVKPEKIYASVSFMPQIFVAFLIAAFAINFNIPFFLLVSLMFVLLGIYKYLLALSYTYYLTDQQLIIVKGVFTKTVNYLELYRIKDIFVNQSFWMKEIGLMNITLLSFDSSESMLILKGIKISELPQSIRNHVQECRQRNKVLTVDN